MLFKVEFQYVCNLISKSNSMWATQHHKGKKQHYICFISPYVKVPAVMVLLFYVQYIQISLVGRVTVYNNDMHFTNKLRLKLSTAESPLFAQQQSSCLDTQSTVLYTLRCHQSVMLSAFQELFHAGVMQFIFVAYSTSLSPPCLLLLKLEISSRIPQEKLIELAACVGQCVGRDSIVRARELAFPVKETFIHMHIRPKTVEDRFETSCLFSSNQNFNNLCLIATNFFYQLLFSFH